MYRDVLSFWFEEIEPAQWWKKDPDFDQLIIDRFAELHTSAIRCELYPWRENGEGRLAEIIVLDQFSRNMSRGKAEAFANDQMALVLAQEAVAGGVDMVLDPARRGFIYLPFMHSESLPIHETALKLYRKSGLSSGLIWEKKHKAIIERFGRYPHRNEILGRKSTEEERLFLTQPNSRF